MRTPADTDRPLRRRWRVSRSAVWLALALVTAVLLTAAALVNAG
jgi:hypothetical protein